MGWAVIQERLRPWGFKGPLTGVYDRETEEAFDSLVEAAQSARDAQARRVSPRGAAAIAAHEGFVPGPYRDSVGVWTIYIGHTATAGGIDPAQMARGMPDDLDAAIRAGYAVFRQDLAKFEKRVADALGPDVAQHEFDAAVSFDFNTGGIHRATWVKSLRAGDRDKAAVEIMNWSKPAAIIGRRMAEQRLFRYGLYPDKPMTVWGVLPSGKVLWQPERTISVAELEGMFA